MAMGRHTLVILCFVGLVQSAPEDIAHGNTEFAFNLYRQISAVSEGDNIFLSPFSVSSAFALLYYGARGQCATQMAETLGYENDEVSHQSYKELNDIIFAQSVGNTVLHQANRLFGQDGISFSQSYRDGLQKYYDAPLEDLSFAEDPESAREHINEWVERETNEKIKDLFPSNSITSQTILVLANALYFKGLWQYPFRPEDTRINQFTLEDGSSVDVDFMHMSLVKAKVNFNDATLKAKILELPYSGNKTAFYIIMPQDGVPLSEIEKHLSHDNLTKAVDDLKVFQSMIRIEVPKFKITWKMSLLGLLYDMGMKCPFGPGADFSGILQAGGNLFASEVIHQAFVDVNEEGTEAAAATGIATTRSRPPKFSARSPFLFLIRDTDSGSVLFLGRVNNPSTTDDEAAKELKFARYRRSELSAETPEDNYTPVTGRGCSPAYSGVFITATFLLVLSNY